MTTTNITVGTTYKNYKELCTALGITPANGCSKKKQLKEIESLLSYKKEGRAFTITEIKALPSAPIADLASLVKEANTKSKRGKHPLYYHFSNYVQALIMQYLQYYGGSINTSYKELGEITGLLNSNYNTYDSNTKTKVYQKVYSIVDYSLKSLQNKHLITYNRIDNNFNTILSINSTQQYTVEEVSKDIIETAKIQLHALLLSYFKSKDIILDERSALEEQSD